MDKQANDITEIARHEQEAQYGYYAPNTLESQCDQMTYEDAMEMEQES